MKRIRRGSALLLACGVMLSFGGLLAGCKPAEKALDEKLHLAFELDNGGKGYRVSAYYVNTEEPSEEIVKFAVPDSYNGAPVTAVKSFGFAFLDDLEFEVTLGKNITTIEEGAFYSVLLESVESRGLIGLIGERAFWNNTLLRSVTLGKGLKEIGKEAFRYCTQLEEIRVDMTGAEWAAVKKGEDWDNETGDYTVYCSDGPIAKAE